MMLGSNVRPNWVPRVTWSVFSATLTVSVAPGVSVTLLGLMERLVTVETTPGAVGVEVGMGTVGLPAVVGAVVGVAADVALTLAAGVTVGVGEGVTVGVGVDV